MPHILVISSLSILYFSVLPTSLTSAGMVTYTILTFFLVLSIITISGSRTSALISQWIVKSHKILHTSFSITPSDLFLHHCGAPSNPCFSHSLQWICLHTWPYIFLYSFWANILHSLKICDTVSFSTLHIINRVDSVVSSEWHFA